jgi:poly(3-hydroxybutyrate) depolymerase
MEVVAMLYHAYQVQTDAAWWPRRWSRVAGPWLMEPPLGGHVPQRGLGAACEVFNLTEVTHRRPDWGIDVAGAVPVMEEVVHETPFATLRRFVRAQGAPGPKVLLAAPMSGHFATLLRDTVRTMVAHHDVYVTDWHNARDVPLHAGRFGFDDYVAHLIEFLERIGPGAHLVAICQPCAAALAAVALLAEEDRPAQPATMTLMAGPIDCRISPTPVNELALEQPIEWFEHHLIAVVPWRLQGAGRRVYPGFLQLLAFMNMNRERHVTALRDYYLRLVADEEAQAAVVRDFYREYFAVADLPAEFYLETVERVFQRHDLARGELQWRGRRIDPARIRQTALLTIEGERDDICGIGQTLAAQDLCTGLRPYMRRHVVQAGVGHYGVFSGRRWQQQIYPQVREMIHVFDTRA